VGGRLIAATLFGIAPLTAASSGDTAQARSYDALSPAQRRLLQVWGAGAPSPEGRDRLARERFDSAPENFRVVFEQRTGHLAAVLLSDPENEEVFGAALGPGRCGLAARASTGPSRSERRHVVRSPGPWSAVPRR
jgi:hypothetical protein